ncbi:MAG: ketoacyl-ACP synthase III [Bacteroidales bacterium]|nr:ketoacyl-ACP synthase III [Bacteroidales bacterium]
MISSVFLGTGSYIPENVVKNEDFLQNAFYSPQGEKIDRENSEIINKLYEISGIRERRYVNKEHVSSDIARLAAEDALDTSGFDREKLDYLIVAHNLGDAPYENPRMDILPPVASRVKAKLGIKNPYTVAYDIPFGCPGWVQGIIQANYYIKSGDAKSALVIGSETLSRIVDPYDRDGMLFSDGAGAALLVAREQEKATGVLSHLTRSDAIEHVDLLSMGKSNNPEYKQDSTFIKMNGRKLYEYALTNVPPLVKEVVDKSGIPVSDIKKILIHQANEKMDEAIVKRFFRLYGIRNIPDQMMPLTLDQFGNNSVATIPIMYDLILKGKLEGQEIHAGDPLVFTSVGAGMNINAFMYQTP